MCNKLQVVFLGFLAVVLVSSCRDRDTGVPLVAIDKEINVTLPQYSNISIIGGWTYATGGSQGLIIYRKTNDEFKVYDRHATFDINEACIVVVDSATNIECLDGCSGSKYSLYDGLVTVGPATLPLKEYRNNYDGTILHIYN